MSHLLNLQQTLNLNLPSKVYRIYLVKSCGYYYLVPKIGAATVQTRPPFDTRKRCLSYYFHNWLQALLSAVTIWGAASNQVNTVHNIFVKCKISIYVKTRKSFLAKFVPGMVATCSHFSEISIHIPYLVESFTAKLGLCNLEYWNSFINCFTV